MTHKICRALLRSTGRAALLALALPGVALAIPVSYLFDQGQVTLTGTVGGAQILGPTTLDLNGVQVTLDTDVPELVSIQLTSNDAITLPLGGGYAGATQISISSLSLEGANGLLSLIDVGPPQQYFYLVSPVDVDLVVSTDGPNALTDELLETTNPSATGTIFLDEVLGQLDLDGITLGAIGPFGSEALPIVLKGDFTFSGQREMATPVPEPAAAVFFACGFWAVTSAVRRRG